jgi:hypothetical protein
MGVMLLRVDFEPPATAKSLVALLTLEPLSFMDCSDMPSQGGSDTKLSVAIFVWTSVNDHDKLLNLSALQTRTVLKAFWAAGT